MKRTQMTITYPGGRQEIEYVYHDEPGVFGSLFRLHREEQLRKAQAERDDRLLQLDRDIKALEDWHHAWRLEHDADYRELHPGEWCERHLSPTNECRMGHWRRVVRDEPWDVITWSGQILRSHRPVQRKAPELPLEVRRAATRTMAKWGSGR
ncbi:hypothetical protein OG912_32475 [Streptomyces sp. NBC_00464]|uniref:hypothetical protein n=1 Tax=Streptomyces sp. NBC_00464 TaxID=2975751 RepID=UPI002E16D9FD